MRQINIAKMEHRCLIKVPPCRQTLGIGLTTSDYAFVHQVSAGPSLSA
jgi:hypothetical protein